MRLDYRRLIRKPGTPTVFFIGPCMIALATANGVALMGSMIFSTGRPRFVLTFFVSFGLCFMTLIPFLAITERFV